MRGLRLYDPAFLPLTAGGGGGGYSDTPDNYGGLIRWYQASSYDDDGLSDMDDVVNDWTDLSATGDDASPDGSNPPHYRPTYMPTGKSALHFSNGHHFDITQITFTDLTILAS